MKEIFFVTILVFTSSLSWGAGDCIFPDDDVEQFWNHGKGWFHEPKRSKMQECVNRNELISYSDYIKTLKDWDYCPVTEYRIMRNKITGKYKLQSRTMPLWEQKMCCDYNQKPDFVDYFYDLNERTEDITLDFLRRIVETRKRYDLLELEKCKEQARINASWEEIKINDNQKIQRAEERP